MGHLRLNGLAKRYGATVAVDDVTLEVGRGEAVALLGPSGCGKTTTLRMVAGLIGPTAGTISLAGVDITSRPPHKRNMGYVFQSYALFPHMTVAGNVGFGLQERGLSRAERDEKVREALAMVRLVGLEGRRPRELSGGQQQRVALARALAIRPDVLLLDESLSNLDAKLRDAMRHEIKEIQRRLAITTLFVTHDQVEALTMCERVAVMDHGRIAQVGTPRDIYDRPATRFVAGFVGRINVLGAEIGEGGKVMVAGSALPYVRGPSTGAVDAFVRPHAIRPVPLAEPVGADFVRITGSVARVVFVGDHVELIADTPAGRLSVEMPAHEAVPAEGSDTALAWRATDTLVFPRAKP